MVNAMSNTSALNGSTIIGAMGNATAFNHTVGNNTVCISNEEYQSLLNQISNMEQTCSSAKKVGSWVLEQVTKKAGDVEQHVKKMPQLTTEIYNDLWKTADHVKEAKQAVESIKGIVSSQPPVETASNTTMLMRECCKYATEKASGVWNAIAPYVGHPVTFTISLVSTAFCTGKAIHAYCSIKRYNDEVADREQEPKKAYAFWKNCALVSGTLAATSGYACLTNQPINN